MNRRRKPPWLKVRYPVVNDEKSPNDEKLEKVLREGKLHTVCEQTACPNMRECFSMGTATFLILGETCTRNCGFCAIRAGAPARVDTGEPARVAEAVKNLGLDFAVVTSVTRDDLSDGGARAFVATATAIKRLSPDCGVELLVPDFRGSLGSLETVVASPLDLLAHNVETVPRLYPAVRPGADYQRSLDLLAASKRTNPSVTTKSGVMLGLGENPAELVDLLSDLRKMGCDAVVIGQYLRPGPSNLPIARYYNPEEFDELKGVALAMGFARVESHPLARSSYKASRMRPA